MPRLQHTIVKYPGGRLFTVVVSLVLYNKAVGYLSRRHYLRQVRAENERMEKELAFQAETRPNFIMQMADSMQYTLVLFLDTKNYKKAQSMVEKLKNEANASNWKISVATNQSDLVNYINRYKLFGEKCETVEIADQMDDKDFNALKGNVYLLDRENRVMLDEQLASDYAQMVQKIKIIMKNEYEERLRKYYEF